MNAPIKIIVGLMSLTIILFGFEVQAAKNGCYCSGSGTESGEVDVSNLPGFITVDAEDKCQLFSKDVNSVSGAPSYQYCAWYVSGTKKTSWKMGVVIDLSQKNGCYCKKGDTEDHPNSDLNNCEIGAANPTLAYDSCTWYDDGQITKVFTKENVGKCVAVYEGNSCKTIPLSECGSVSDSVCVPAFPVCKIRDDIDQFCGKQPLLKCKELLGFCTWQGAGTDVNKPVDNGEVGPPLLASQSTFDATVLNKLGTTDVKIYIARIIKGAMGILGSITLVMFVYSGILFMTDRGSGENVDKAKEIAVWTTLGLVVIFASYAMINFIFQIFAL